MTKILTIDELASPVEKLTKDQRYNRSAKGKARQQCFDKSEKGKAMYSRYNHSDKGATREAWRIERKLHG